MVWSLDRRYYKSRYLIKHALYVSGLTFIWYYAQNQKIGKPGYPKLDKVTYA